MTNANRMPNLIYIPWPSRRRGGPVKVLPGRANIDASPRIQHTASVLPLVIFIASLPRVGDAGNDPDLYVV